MDDLLLTPDANRLLVYEYWQAKFRLFDLTRGRDAEPVWAFGVRTWSMDTHASFELLPDGERFVVATSDGYIV